MQALERVFIVFSTKSCVVGDEELVWSKPSEPSGCATQNSHVVALMAASQTGY
jgi:hypothetical protein